MAELVKLSRVDKNSRVSADISTSAVHVAVGVIINANNQILVAQRHAHQHQGGKWEFPGGKVEIGETVEQALSRELKEEVGIEVTQSESLTQIQHDYPDKSVLLDVQKVTGFIGNACGKEQQAIQWVSLDELTQFDMPEANHTILRCLL
tara:strand:- start:27156 stop:27602 length:447 start_codon:yes stop_codon:yes gene_type:complete